MKTTFVSTSALQNSARLAVQRAQQEIADKQVEAVTGRYADVGLALGSQTTRSISLTRDVERLNTMLGTNALAEQRLSVSQDALGEMSDNGQTMLETLITIGDANDEGSIDIAKRGLESALKSFTSLANMSSSGEFLFAGINTDVRPVEDYFAVVPPATASPAKEAFDTALATFLATAPSGPDISTLSPADMEDFLTNVVEPMFTGADWNTNWSQASDTNMNSRITKNEVIETSTNANAEGFRKFAMAAVVGMELIGADLAADTRAYLSESLIGMAGNAINAIDADRAQLGVSEARLAKGNESLLAQRDVLETYLGELEGVDPYEATTRITSLLTQMEASYALTARLQNMSLINYL